ncbi:glycosyl transferase [Pseudomonas frederiksbergensis]|uniref:Glycosyl transferase n=1 Tax=Pseudomonas frederiksbergensis TaxID=104087 RepID=A0A2S8HL58_9PSED|nr:glycosyltransferase [Pseudomonas frederiksbergensis]PQP03260.1 glycosyl transferase [Pseudomonas frederiksbergensis]
MPVRVPKVAVLLAAYNGMQWIEEQLASIQGQLDVDVTIYISIDPSTDGTEAWCAAYAEAHPQIFILPDAGKFGGASRNFFRLIRDVDFAPYDFIALADQDDIWHADKLRRATRAIESRQIDSFSSNVTAFWPDGRTHLLDKAQSQVAWDFLFEAAGPGCTYVFNKIFAMALKASVIADWQKVQEVRLHDWYCYAFARSHGYRWFIDPVPTMEYRQHANNQVGANKGLHSLLARYKTIHDGWWFSQVRMIARLIGQGDDPFVSSWLQLRRGQLIRLSFNAWKCRRRWRDKVFFFFVCWVFAFSGNKSE